MNNDFFSFSLNLVAEAGNIIKENFLKKKKARMKSRREILTDTDIKVEKKIINAVRAGFPGMAFISEETNPDAADSGECVYLDPIDGTNNFYYGIPFVAVSFAYYKKGIGRFGIVYNPILDEMFVGIKGKGAFLNGGRIRVSKTVVVRDALLATGLPYIRKKNGNNNLKNILNFGLASRDIRRMGSASLDMCYTAKGVFDGYWELGLKAWDIAAGAVILREAGGQCTNFFSENLDLCAGNFLATNGVLHPEMRKILKMEGLR